VEQPLQLAFAQIDRSSALDERIEDLLAAADAYLPSDTVRALYYANEALGLAESRDRIELQMRALQMVIAAMQASGRTAGATPYIVRAIDLADAVDAEEVRAPLVDLLAEWAIAVEQDDPRASPDWRERSPVNWAKAMIARLERAQGAEAAPDSSRRDIPGIDDVETGLLNALGLAAELLALEERQTEYALIQMRVSGHETAMLVEISRRAAQMVGDRGLVARNDHAVLTALLPSLSGIAAMAMAEHLRVSLAKGVADTNVTIGIGVAIKQPGETSRDVLRRVVDRAEEATYQPGVTVAG
jgi:hypothetical protein